MKRQDGDGVLTAASGEHQKMELSQRVSYFFDAGSDWFVGDAL